MSHDELSSSICRIIHEKYDIHGPMSISIHMTLPPFLTSTYVTRHKLSPVDIRYLIDVLSTQIVWLSAVVLGIDMPISAIHMSKANHRDVYITNKNIVVAKLVNKLQSHTAVENKIDSINTYGHVPSLPRHVISDTEYIFLHSIISPCTSIYNNHVPSMYIWGGKQWIGLSMEGIYIYAVRIVSLEIYNIVYRKKLPDIYAYMSTCVYIQNVPYIITEEGVLFRRESENVLGL